MISDEEARSKLAAILDGIDRQETDEPEGWWETSTGAEFGAGIKAKLSDLLDDILNEDPRS